MYGLDLHGGRAVDGTDCEARDQKDAKRNAAIAQEGDEGDETAGGKSVEGAEEGVRREMKDMKRQARRASKELRRGVRREMKDMRRDMRRDLKMAKSLRSHVTADEAIETEADEE